MGNSLENKFAKMGARAKVSTLPALLSVMGGNRVWNGRAFVAAGGGPNVPVRVDIGRDRDGEFFDVRHRADVAVEVVDLRADDRHLLLMARETEPSTGRPGVDRPAKSKFLCGHDERHWFVAAVPESAHARDVQDAKDALKPREVWGAIFAHDVRGRKRDRRRNEAFVRQGEWFFLPRPDARVDEKLSLRNEPLRRGAGKPHVCQFLVRTGGTTVYVCPVYPNGLSVAEYNRLPQGERAKHRWTLMSRDPRVYVKGTVRHSDHATLHLSVWHQVVMNTETRARAMSHVAFLD